MLHIEILEELQRNKLVFENQLKELPKELVVWKAKPNDWCILEIACHLLDEEVEDFRTRTKHALETPDLRLKSINPTGWPTERAYLDQNFEEVLKKFLFERQISIEWLKSLECPNWENTLLHVDLGGISAKSFLHNWLAHDYHHIRQINNIKREYLKSTSGNDLTYAGNW